MDNAAKAYKAIGREHREGRSGARLVKAALDLRDTVDYRACQVHGKDYLAGCTNCDRNAAIDAFDKAVGGE